MVGKLQAPVGWHANDVRLIVLPVPLNHLTVSVSAAWAAVIAANAAIIEDKAKAFAKRTILTSVK